MSFLNTLVDVAKRVGGNAHDGISEALSNASGRPIPQNLGVPAIGQHLFQAPMVDKIQPGRFDYMPRPNAGLLQSLTHFNGPEVQSLGQAGFNAPQMESYNPGFIPLQNSGYGGPGYGANLQGGMQTRWQNVGQGVSPDMVNPQVNDNGYRWY